MCTSCEDDQAQARNRLHQHVRLRPGPWSRNLMVELNRLYASGAAFLQAEHSHYEGYLRRYRDVPRILSTHNVDSQVEAGHARQLPAGPARLRHRYRTYRYVRGERASGRVADAVLCVSEDDAAYYRQYADNVLVTPNGVDDAFFTAGRDETAEETVMFFGQMSYPPNLEGLMRFVDEGWSHVLERRPNARLLIAGQGGRERLGSFVDDRRISVLGVVDDIAALVGSVRVVVVPVWRGGGTRLKVLEALAAGRPLVGTALGVSGIGFEDGVHGVIAEEPREMARHVADLCARPDAARALGRSGQALVEQYRWRHALRPAEALYAELVQKARDGVPPDRRDARCEEPSGRSLRAAD